MFALILAAGLASGVSPYTTETAHAFASVANDRILDGVTHSNGEGVLSAGLLFTDPGGLFANTRLSAFTGSGKYLPEESLLALDTAIGWQFDADQHRVSVLLLDYRLANAASIDYQGAALRYAYRQFSLEIAVEPERYYYYPAYDAFAPYDARRAQLEWRSVPGKLQWYAGAGWLEAERVPGHMNHVAAGVIWRWQGFDWQTGVVHAWRNQPAAVDDEGTHVFLSVTRSFRWR